MKLRKILKIKKSINSRVPLTYTWFTQVGHTHYLRIIRERHLTKSTRARDVNEKNKNKSNVKTRVPLTYTWFTQANDRTYYKRGHQLTYSSARNLSEKWILEKIMNSWALGTYEKYARPEDKNVLKAICWSIFGQIKIVSLLIFFVNSLFLFASYIKQSLLCKSRVQHTW